MDKRSEAIVGVMTKVAVVRKNRDGKWELVAKDGKILGTHDNPRKAYGQEYAITKSEEGRAKKAEATQYMDATRGQLKWQALFEALLGSKRFGATYGGTGGMQRFGGAIESLLGTDRALGMVGVPKTSCKSADYRLGELMVKQRASWAEQEAELARATAYLPKDMGAAFAFARRVTGPEYDRLVAMPPRERVDAPHLSRMLTAQGIANDMGVYPQKSDSVMQFGPRRAVSSNPRDIYINRTILADDPAAELRPAAPSAPAASAPWTGKQIALGVGGGLAAGGALALWLRHKRKQREAEMAKQSASMPPNMRMDGGIIGKAPIDTGGPTAGELFDKGKRVAGRIGKWFASSPPEKAPRAPRASVPGSSNNAVSRATGTLKQSMSRGLSDVPTGRGPAQINQALGMYETARALVRPSNEELKDRGLGRPAYEHAVRSIAAAADDNKLNLTDAAPPKIPGWAIGAGAAVGGLAGLANENKVDGVVGGAALGAGAAGAWKLRNDYRRDKLMRTAKLLKDYGVLDAPTLRRVLPLMYDKSPRKW